MSVNHGSMKALHSRFVGRVGNPTNLGGSLSGGASETWTYGTWGDISDRVEAWRKGAHLSNSAISTYVRCPSQFLATYVLALGDSSGDPASFGTVLHNAMEARVEGEPFDLVREYANSSLTSLGEIEDAERMIGEVLTHAPMRGQVVGVEWRFARELPVSGATLHGAVDLTYVDTSGVLVVRDYKSNQQLYTSKEVEESKQLLLYLDAVIDEFGANFDRFRVEYVMFRHNARVQRYDGDDIRAKAAGAWRWADALAVRMLSDDVFPEKLNKWCAYCDQVEGCTAMARAEKHGTVPDWGGEIARKSPAQLVQLLIEVKGANKALTAKKFILERQLKATLIEMAERGEDAAIVAGDHVATVHTRKSRAYPTLAVLDLLDIYGDTDIREVVGKLKMSAAAVDKALRVIKDRDPEQHKIAKAAVDAVRTYDISTQLKIS